MCGIFHNDIGHAIPDSRKPVGFCRQTHALKSHLAAHNNLDGDLRRRRPHHTHNDADYASALKSRAYRLDLFRHRFHLGKCLGAYIAACGSRAKCCMRDGQCKNGRDNKTGAALLHHAGDSRFHLDFLPVFDNGASQLDNRKIEAAKFIS